MEKLITDKREHDLNVSNKSVRRRLLQNALQHPLEQAIKSSTSKVQFREPESPGSIQRIARDMSNSNIGEESPALVRTIELLCVELEARRREVQELHILLRQAIDSNTQRPWWAQAVTPYWQT